MTAMKDFTLALVQHDSRLGKTDDNLELTIKWITKAAKAGAQLVALPELGVTSHGGHVSMIEPAEEIPNGPICETLIDVAADLGVYINFGMAEREGPTVYNAQVTVGPEGYLGKQRKIHLSNDEYFFFRGGTEMPVIELPFVKLGSIICYDNEHPEPARCLAIDGAELILSPHAARSGSMPRDAKKIAEKVKAAKEHYKLVHRCRARDNACFVGLCNMAGSAAKGIKGVEANHFGSILVVDPNGDVIAESKSRGVKDEMVLVELKAQVLEERRNQSCLPLRTRKPNAFASITRPTA